MNNIQNSVTKTSLLTELSSSEQEQINGGKRAEHSVGGSAKCNTNGSCEFSLTYTVKF